MNKGIVCKVIGVILMIEGGLLILPMLIAFIYREGDWKFFLMTAAGSVILGFLMNLVKSNKKSIHAADGYIIVALAWIALSAVGAVPFVISGSIPNYLDALFETVSGFTTTGSTILNDIEALSKSMLFWRSFTHWIGGMGILVFMLAITPVASGGSAIHMLRAESPGPTTEKISPKISTTAKYLYLIYIMFTLAEVVCLIISGLSVYGSFLISFGTMATGGFSFLNTSMAAFTVAQQNIVLVFMIIAGANFSLYFLIATGKGLAAIKNEEFLGYILVFVVSTVMITVNVFMSGNFGTFGEALQKTAFMVASVITTTGFSVCNTDVWPFFSKNLILLIMFFGACAGSTAGGIKVSRIEIALKNIKNSLLKMIHPRSVNTVRYNYKDVSSEVINGVSFYICIFAALFAASLFIVSIDPKCDFMTAFSAVDTTINNNGISFAGAAGSFSGFAWYSKIIFIIDMLIGRLEIFPIIILFGSLFNPVSSLTRKIRHKIKSV